ncbi:MAG: DUF2971 domain-containing protein [Bryobacterales bacterium]|nr:DUF2971 domain-containing protein [Bryobacterales bacterium]
MSTAFNPTTDPDRLRGFLNSIGSFSEDLILWFNVEQKLYHYTNLDGLRGIVSNSDLWLTHAQYCNDEEELTHGVRLTRSVIEEQAQPADPKRREYLAELLRLLDSPQLDPVYICCFCEKDDLLSQWRAYAANATGVSLEFEPAGFAYTTGPDCPPAMGLMRFWKVFYPPETQRKIIRSAIDYYPRFEPGSEPADWARWTAEAIRFFIPTFKNSDFQEEKEWRLIFTPAAGSPAQPSYRVARGMLAPYYSLSELARQLGRAGQKLPLTAVRIGPGPNKRLNAASVRMLLDRHGYDHVRVDQSETPYRG